MKQLKYGAKTKAEEKVLDKKYKRGEIFYNFKNKEYNNLMEITKKLSARDIIENSILEAKAQLGMIKFALIERYETEEHGIKEGSLREETDPLSCISSLYLKGIRKSLLRIEDVLHIRANEIQKKRKQFRERKG